MKNTYLTLLVAAAISISACTTTPPLTEQAPAVTKEMVIQESPLATETVAPLTQAPDAAVIEEVSFSRDIYPILEEFAYPAHSTIGKGGIFLETYEDIMQHVVPGNPEESELYQRITGDGVPVMPPTGKLPDETIQLFYNWISQGARNN